MYALCSVVASVDDARVLHDFYPGRSADGLAIDREGIEAGTLVVPEGSEAQAGTP